MPTLDATPNGPNANSFLTVAEGQAYWDTRIPFNDVWENADDQAAALIMATRVLTAYYRPRRQFIPPVGSRSGYYIIYPTWTGLPATTTQALPWGRTGMFDGNGNAIPSNVIPQPLKDATAELAGQLVATDRLADNDAGAQGISSVKAGSVAVSFKEYTPTSKPLPDSVTMLLVPSWLTDQVVEPMYVAQFDVVAE